MKFEPTFDMYGITPPPGDWAYVLDDTGIAFGPGWWPFHRDGAPAGIRVSPDVEFRSWRNEYVLLYPSTSGPAAATARITLYVRPQGMGAMTVVAYLGLDIRQRTYTLPDGLPEHLHEKAITKAQRLLDFISNTRADRRRGSPRPRTAADIATETQQ